MPGFLASIWAALAGSTETFNEQAIGEQITAFQLRLADGQPEHDVIRLWVESGSSYGHQSSTVNLLYRIAKPDTGNGLNLGYAGTIEVYYETPADLPKLYELIPEMGGQPAHQVGNAQVQLILYSGVPAQLATFGLTGGAGSSDEFAPKLNVSYFLRLQPYNWPGSEQIEFASGRTPIDLTAVEEVGAERFKRRLYYVEQTMYANPPWATFLSGNASPYDKEKLRIVQYLFSDNVLQAFQLQAAYSIKTGSLRFNQNTTFGAALICAGAFEWQNNGRYARARPVIIVNFDEFGTAADSSGDDLKTVLAGGFAVDESMFQIMVNRGNRDAVDNYRRRQAYFQGLAVGNRIHYLNYPQTLVDVQNAVGLLTGRRNEVLFIQLGRSFPAVFSYALYRSGLPPIFEGQNTANDAVNIGRPYLQIPATNATEEQQLRIYPSVTLAQYTSQQVPQGMLSIASQISSSPLAWPTAARNAPPAMIGQFYQQYTNERPTDTINQYFAKVREFFANPAQDKLLLAVAYLNTVLPPVALSAKETTPQEARAELEPAPGTTPLSTGAELEAIAALPANPLDALWDAINTAIAANKTIDLIPGILVTGAIPAFMLSFLKDFAAGLTLTVSSFAPAVKPDPLTEITVAGSTDVFAEIGVKNSVQIDFTAPDGALTAQFRFTAEETWSMPDAPWMAFDRPFVELRVRDAGLPVVATIGGYYPALESTSPPIVARLQISVGGATGRWPASISFSPPTYPGIATAYQLATGFNLVSRLPAPFNVAADLGISSVEVEYDTVTSTVDSIVMVAQSNTPNLTLLGNLVLDDLTVTAVVLNPTTTRILLLGVSAEFRMGPAANPAVVTISVHYPDLMLRGALSSGTPTFTDLLATFVPALVGVSLPHEPRLDEFDFTYQQSNDYLTVSTLLSMPDWDFTFPLFSDPLFSLDTIGFSITRDRSVNTGSITAHTTLLPRSQAPIGVAIAGSYLANQDLRLSAKTTTVVDVGTLIGEYLGAGWVPHGLTLPKLKDVGVTLLWGGKDGGSASAKSFEFTAKTATPWEPIDAVGSELSVTADLTIGYTSEKNAGAYGKLVAAATLWFIRLKVEYNFDPTVQSVAVTWVDLGLKALLTTNTGGDQIATFTLEDQTVGSIISTFVGWATGTEFGLVAPFNVLDDISLSGLKVTYNFTKKKVDFTVDIGPINFGLFTITEITLAYNPNGNDDGKSDNKVEITINGSFAWQDGDKLSWEPDDPSTTPAPPGGGNKYLDLRLLALGQHVTVPGLVTENDVAAVIAKLEVLDIPKPPEIPVGGENQPVFDAASSWFVAFDFGLLKVEEKPDESQRHDLVAAGRSADDQPQYFISLAVVFNDPVLYALRLGLEGPMAKIFAGLDFQVMYQQVSQNVGRYSAQIALPAIMRKFQIGVASVTLPIFAIEIYTNGDFQVDLGFPWNEDFTRSFSIEVQAGPLPVVGSAGFYFGKLSSGTTDKVPHDTRPGWFNPVIVFGFGAQVGLGKSIEAGILRAGFSVTVFGIIEGVIARWQPYGEITPGGDKNSLQDGYFFSLSGAFGLQGRLYGSIDFAIISAELDVQISLYVRITFASYAPIPITAKASVSVTLTIKINLGLFKISIHLSFKAAIEVTFVLDNPMGDPSKAPWAPIGRAAAMTAPQRLAARGLAKSIASASGLAAIARGGLEPSDVTPFVPVWTNLQPGTTLRLAGWVAPVLTVAGDIATRPADQQVCYVLNFFLDSGDPPLRSSDQPAALGSRSDAHVVPTAEVAGVAFVRARRERGNAVDPDAFTNTFDDLAVRVLQWIIAAGTTAKTPDEVDQSVVSDDFLAAALSYLSGATTPTPVPGPDIETFLQAQTRFLFGLDQGANPDGQPATAVFFPAAPGVTLDVGAFGGQGPFSYAFGSYNSSSSDYLSQLNTYFNELKVQVADEQRGPRPKSDEVPTADGPSIASYIFGDYFAMVGRLTIQSVRDGLRNFKLPVVDQAGRTVRQIVDAINAIGQLDGDAAYTIGELFTANQTHPLAVGAAGPGGPGLVITTMAWQSPGSLGFAGIAGQPVFAGRVDPTALALANSARATIIAPNLEITGPGGAYRTQSADSLEAIAVALGYVDSGRQADVAALLAAVPTLLTRTDLLAPQAILVVPPLRHPVVAGDTLQGLVSQYGITLDALAEANDEVTALFADDPVNLDVPHLPQYQVGALVDELKRTLALQHLGAMVSRYYLHGLRLPTAFGTGVLTPQADGLFVTKGGEYPPDLGLFALTGQAFPLGDLPAPPAPGAEDSVYSFTVNGATEPWLSLGTEGETSVTFTLTSADDYERYRQVKAVAADYLDTQTAGVGPLDVAGLKPRRYPLSIEIAWQPAVDFALPRQQITPATPKPRLWVLPDQLINTPDGGAVHPTLKPLLARSDEATGTTLDEEVANYGFGTLVSFTVKKLSAAVISSSAVRTYEIIGAPESEIALLERLLDQLTDDPGSFAAVNLCYRPSSTGSAPQGWQSDDPAVSLMGMTQTNLSTQTRPPVSTSQVDATAASAHPNLIGTPNDFMRLLWEASITRQGGFYLTYTTDIGGDLRGLPDHAFNDRDEAEIAVFALFATGSDAGQALHNFMNVAATNEAFDLSQSALVAEAVPVPVPTPRAFATTDSLTSYAASYYTGPGALAEQNADARFAAGIRLSVAGGLYQVPANPGATPTVQDPGADLAQIAAHFGTSPAAIRAVNPGTLPDTVPPLTAMKLPRVTVASDGQSLRTLAAYYNTPIAELAAANRVVVGLYPVAPLTVSTGPATLAPVIRPGVAGLQLQRVAPEVPDTPTADWGLAYLRQDFSLLAYRVATNNGNNYFPQSNWGLPSGPVDPAAALAGADKIQAPDAAAAGDPWPFRFTVPYASALAAGKPAASPYGGVGAVLQFDLAWLDIFGNRILSEFDDPAGTGRPTQRQPQLTGYTDRLVGVGQWPAVAGAYQIISDPTSGAPSLMLEFDFDASAYVDAARAVASPDSQPALAGKNTIDQGIAAYTVIAQQLSDPSGVTIELTTSITPSASWTLPDSDPERAVPGQPASLRAWVGTILAFLEALIADPNSPPPAGYQSSVLLEVERLSTDQIFTLDAVVTIRRRSDLVAGELATVVGVGAAATSIAPYTGSLDTALAAQPQRNLTTFAKNFTAAFSAIAGTEFRIATGTDRAQIAGGGQSPIWVVQLGLPGAGQPISFTMSDAGAPAVYAPRPISNVLASKAATPIIGYTTGSVIRLDGGFEIRSFASVDLDKWMAATLASIDELFSPKYTSTADLLRRNIAGVPNPVGGSWPDALASLVAAKEKLAGNLKAVMIPVYDGESVTAQQQADIQEAFYQQMLTALGGFYGVKAGIQFTADVVAAIRREPDAVQVPRVYGDIGNAGAGTAVSLSSPKLDLPVADPGPGLPPPSPYLSTLLNSTSTEAKAVALDLTYEGRYIEHDIGRLAGIDGYEPSAWLSFVDIGDGAVGGAGGNPLSVPLGTFDVPIVLREFPPTPTLVNQDEVGPPTTDCYQPLTAEPAVRAVLLPAMQCLRSGAYDPVATATRWNYAFTYSMQVHRQQDEIHALVRFNVAGPAGLVSNADAGRDVFDNLAQFAQVFPQVRNDLNAYLLPIEVGTTDPTQLKNAQAALESAAAMIDWLGTSPPTLSRGRVHTDAVTASPVTFTISEGDAPIGGVDALVVEITLTGSLPARVGEPFVEIAGYTCERQPGSSDLVGVFAYKSNTDGSYLPASVGMSIAARTVILPDLDILERQDAQAEIYITRNADLVPNRTIAEPFVYTTPTVSFETPLHPTLVVDEPINLATIFSTGPQDPVRRPLDCQLGLLYDALFANAGTADVTMQVGLYYEYEINSAIEKVRLPVFLMPPTQTVLAAGGTGMPLADMIAMQVAGWADWFGTQGPVTAGGSLLLDLTVMSDLTSRPMPILHLSGLFVPYSDLT